MTVEPAPEAKIGGMNATVLRAWGTIIISTISTFIFIGLIIAVYFVADPQLHSQLMILLVNTGVINFTTVVNYFMGSSAGSAQKDERPPPT